MFYSFHRWASLDQSELTYTDNLIGSAKGRVQYNGVQSDTNGTFLFFTHVKDGNESPVLNTTQIVNWYTGSEWSDSGSVGFGSWLNLPGIMWYNTTGIFKYGGDMYKFELSEYDSTNGATTPQDHVLCYGHGHYGGSSAQWYMKLNNSTLLYNSNLVGTANGGIKGTTPNNWYEGLIDYTSHTFDQNHALVLSTDGSLLWESPEDSSYTERGYFRLKSLVDIPSGANWNATGSFGYSDHEYKLNLYEQNYVTNNDEEADSHFLTYVEGGYGGSSATQA